MSITDPYQLIREQNERSARRQAANDAAYQRHEAWTQAWIDTYVKLAADPLLALGQQLQAHSAGLWLDYFDLALARDLWVLESGLKPNFERNGGYPYQVLAVMLLKAALLADRQRLETELARITSGTVYFGIINALQGLAEPLWNFCHGSYPPTPFVSRSELAEALRRRVPTLGVKSGVTYSIKTASLQIQEESQPATDGKTTYCLFQHKDPKMQRIILQSVVAWMRNNSPIGSSFYSGLWTGESLETRG
jgi:hypothetical protein